MEEIIKNKRGIYLVANRKSESFCENLIYSIRTTGCLLPIRLIPFGGLPVKSTYILEQAEVYELSRFPKEGLEFINQLRTVLVDCPLGFLYRFLAWFGDWDEFIYSDNDVVAFLNWEKITAYLNEYDFVHADEEYTTYGKYNYYDPELIERIFGTGSLLTAFTAGHFAARCNQSFVADMVSACEWYKNNPGIPKKHDQSLMHIASLIGNWKILNLCKEPNNWLSPWAGDYDNTLTIIQAIQRNYSKNFISHIHYSGGIPTGTSPVEELLFASSDTKTRLRALIYRGMKDLSGISYLNTLKRKAKVKMKALFTR